MTPTWKSPNTEKDYPDPLMQSAVPSYMDCPLPVLRQKGSKPKNARIRSLRKKGRVLNSCGNILWETVLYDKQALWLDIGKPLGLKADDLDNSGRDNTALWVKLFGVHTFFFQCVVADSDGKAKLAGLPQ